MNHGREVVKRRRERLERVAASGEPGADIARQLLDAVEERE